MGGLCSGSDVTVNNQQKREARLESDPLNEMITVQTACTVTSSYKPGSLSSYWTLFFNMPVVFFMGIVHSLNVKLMFALIQARSDTR